MVRRGLPVADSIETRLAAYRTAELDLLTYGQSVAVPGRNLTMANLADVQRLIRELELMVARKNAGPIRLGRGVG
jgi:hypothetical protein